MCYHCNLLGKVTIEKEKLLWNVYLNDKAWSESCSAALFSWISTFPYLRQKSLYLNPLWFARQHLGNNDIFLIDYLVYKVMGASTEGGGALG